MIIVLILNNITSPIVLSLHATTSDSPSLFRFGQIRKILPPSLKNPKPLFSISEFCNFV